MVCWVTGPAMFPVNVEWVGVFKRCEGGGRGWGGGGGSRGFF